MQYEIYDLDAERNVLRSLYHNAEFTKSVFMMKNITVDFFTEAFNRDAFRLLEKYYRKFGKLPPKNHAQKIMPRILTRIKGYSTKKKQIKFWVRALDKIYVKPEKNYSARADIDLLLESLKGRIVQKSIIESGQNFEDGDYEKALEVFKSAYSESNKQEMIVTEGDLLEDLDYHFALDKEIKFGNIKPLALQTIGAIEKSNGEVKFVLIDNYLGGGIYRGEMHIYIGDVNIGKSFQLMEDGLKGTKCGMNCVIYTIEMQKMKQQRRLLSRISGVPYYKFRKGELTKTDKKLIRSKVEEWYENNARIYVVAFDKGATVLDIENKHKEIEAKYGEEFPVLVLDYMNDMKPIGRYVSDKNWEAQGEISWDLASLAKHYNNHKGLYLITASQKKTAKVSKAKPGKVSGAFSSLPEHHATTVITLSQDESDEVIPRIRYAIAKNRDGERAVVYYGYPDFKKSRISSIRKMKNFYGK